MTAKKVKKPASGKTPNKIPEKNKQKPTTFGKRIGYIYLFLFGILGIWYFMSMGVLEKGAEIDYSQFRSLLQQENVERIHVQGGEITGDLKEAQQLRFAQNDTTSFDQFRTYIPSFGDDQLFELLEQYDVEVSAEAESESYWWYFIVFGMPLVIILIIGYVFFQRMQAQGRSMMSIGQSKAKLQDPEKNKTKFDDVAGQEGAKTELREVIAFLKNPEHFKDLGAKLPKGILLVGPPGTGKTLLARAAAGEAGVPFFTITGSDFMEMFVGVGAKRVREMFKKAKEASPSIIFVDEIDSIGRSRGAGLGGGHDEREQTLNQLLSELDGFEPSENVIVIAATNRPDILDKALLRPGRFDRQITIDLPSQESRVDILKIHARNKPLHKNIDLDTIARSTPGFSGADLENLLNEAALYTGREKRKKIQMKDVEKARDKVLMGLEREGMKIDDEEKQILAYHEAGHALVAAVLPHADPVHKVTIIPRGRAMGVTQQLPKKEKYLYNKEYLVERLAVIMGGRAAEQLIFNTSTSGAQNDLQQVSKMARKMVMDWGMSDKFTHLSFGTNQEEVFLGREMSKQKEYSDATAREIDQEIQKISREAYELALKTIKEYRKVLDRIAEGLIEKEEIPGDEVLRLLNKIETNGEK